MLLRTVALLLLCASVAMCATLGHYQAQAKEAEEKKTVEEEEEAPVVHSAAVSDAVVAAASADAAADVAATAAEQGDDAPAAEEAAEILTVDQPAANNNGVDVLMADGDVPAGDSPAVEALAEEAVTQEPATPEEEGNEITPVETNTSLDRPTANEDKSGWGLNSIRNSFQTMHGYFDSMVELVGGHDGVCQYRCRYGETPQPRAGYQLPEPNGCSSSLVGFQLDLGVPVMTKCCDQLDMCYDTCGTSKPDCDAVFRSCLLDICSDLRKSLGFVSQAQACDSMAGVLYSTVGTLGCRPYMNSQRAACVCGDEERDEL